MLFDVTRDIVFWNDKDLQLTGPPCHETAYPNNHQE